MLKLALVRGVMIFCIATLAISFFFSGSLGISSPSEKETWLGLAYAAVLGLLLSISLTCYYFYDALEARVRRKVREDKQPSKIEEGS